MKLASILSPSTLKAPLERAEAARAHNRHTATYLLGIPLLADYLGESHPIFILGRGQKFDWLYYHWREKRRVKQLSGLNPREQFYLEEAFSRTAHHEHRAALVCVLTALVVSRNRFTAVGEESGGWFFLPPWECWAEWAQEAVEDKASALNREGACIQILRSVVQK